MSPETFPSVLRFAVGYFWVALLFLHTVVFLELRRRGKRPGLLASMAVRDHLVRALVRGGAAGSIAVTAAFVLWWVLHRPAGGSALIATELLLSFTLAALGFASVAARFSFRLIERQGPAGVPLMRVAFLFLGAGYGVALWLLLPSNPMETVISVLILGGALVVLGLNRTDEISAETLARLAGGE